MKNKKLTIAFVSDAIYPYNKGGKEKRLYEISTRLTAAGHDVHIYCMKWWGGKEKNRIENGVHLHAISPLYPLYSGKRRSIMQAVKFAFACFKLLNKDFDIIDVDHMPHLILFPLKIVSIIKRKKLYTTWNEVWGRKYWVEYMGKLGNMAYVIEWLSARMPDTIIAVSEHTKRKLLKDLKVKNDIYVIPNGIDISMISKIKASKTKSDVIFAGRLLTHKNVHVLIRSAKELLKDFPNLKIIIVGDGPEKKNLEKLAFDMGLSNHIQFSGFLKDYKNVYALFKASKVFVFPSTREGFGIVALEANASGIPVITINHKDNAAKDLIKDGKNGQVIKLDQKLLAKTVKKYLKTKLLKKNYINAVNHYDWFNEAKRIEEVYAL